MDHDCPKSQNYYVVRLPLEARFLFLPRITMGKTKRKLKPHTNQEGKKIYTLPQAYQGRKIAPGEQCAGVQGLVLAWGLLRKEHAFNFLLCLGPDVTYITLLRTMKSLSFHYLQINRLDCHSFMNADRRHKIPESETVDSLSLTSQQVKGFELSSAVSIELSRRSMIKLYLSHTGDDLETQQLQKL